MGDPYGHSDLEAKHPDSMFLEDRHGYDGETTKIRPIAGYNFIEIQVRDYEHPERYKRIEVIGRIRDRDGHRLETHTEYSATARSRYAYDWEDISSEEDRKYWIAGGRMRVIDLMTRTTIAERTGYMIDMGQGAVEAGRTPWSIANKNACPRFESDLWKAKEFVTTALKPVRESKRD
jgi:hypothetical protein